MLLNKLGNGHLFGLWDFVIQSLSTIQPFPSIEVSDLEAHVTIWDQGLHKHGLDQGNSDLKVPIGTEVTVDAS